jgi:hypothetical protein
MTKLVRVLGLVCAGATAAASAAEFTPTIDLGVIRTDNLTQVGVDPEAATVWKVVPAFTFTQDSNRFQTDAVVRAEAYRYQQRSESEVFTSFDGNMRAALIPDRFFFNVGGARTQAIVDPESAIPISNLMISTNRVDLDEYYAGPAFALPAGANAVVTGDIRRTRYRFDDPIAVGQDDYDYDTGVIAVDNYRKRSGMTWAARYNHERAEYETQLPFERRQASVEIGFWANDVTRLFVSGGKESPWDEPLETGLEDSFWEAGFARTSDRLSAEVGVGERTFGSSRRGQLTYNFGRGNTLVSYSETPTTNAGDRFARGGLLRPDEPLDYLFRAGSIERYVSKRAQWTLNFDLERMGFTAGLFDETRDERTQADGAPLDDEEQSGANVSVTWKARTKLDVVLSAAEANRVLADTGETDLKNASLAVVYRLGSRTQLDMRLERWEEVSREAAGIGYEANVLSATVARTFR